MEPRASNTSVELVFISSVAGGARSTDTSPGNDAGILSVGGGGCGISAMGALKRSQKPTTVIRALAAGKSVPVLPVVRVVSVRALSLVLGVFRDGGGAGVWHWILLSQKTPCHPSPQKHTETPAQLREPTRAPLLYSRPVTLSPGKTLEGAKRVEEGETAGLLLWKAGQRWPRCPLELCQQAGSTGTEFLTVASRRGDQGIHTCGSPYCQTDTSSNKHSHANDPHPIKTLASKDKATCPIRITPCLRRSSVPRWQP